MDPNQQFISKLEDKKYLANKANRAENTDKIVNKLEEIKPTPFPDKVKMELVNEPNDLAKAFFSMLKGDKGDSPIKGKDYLTNEELQQIKDEVTPKLGTDYQLPENGKDYILTDEDKKEIAKKIKVPIVEKIIEKTETIKEQPIITNEVKEVAVAETAEQIVQKLQAIKQAWLELSQIKGLQELINESGANFLNQAKSLVPRSLSGLYDVDVRTITDQQTLVFDAVKRKFVPGTPASGTGFTKETPTGTVDGANQTFTVTHTPNYVVSDGTTMFENAGYTIVGLTLTMTAPPVEYIRSYY